MHAKRTGRWSIAYLKLTSRDVKRINLNLVELLQEAGTPQYVRCCALWSRTTYGGRLHDMIRQLGSDGLPVDPNASARKRAHQIVTPWTRRDQHPTTWRFGVSSLAQPRAHIYKFSNLEELDGFWKLSCCDGTLQHGTLQHAVAPELLHVDARSRCRARATALQDCHCRDHQCPTGRHANCDSDD